MLNVFAHELNLCLAQFPVTGGKHYHFGAIYHAKGVAVPRRSIVAEIHWRDADGKNLQRMTEIGEDMPYAVFSPDGKQFAFMGLAGIYILDADGKNIHSLFRDGGHGRLDWKK